jgi:hypothetical protein
MKIRFRFIPLVILIAGIAINSAGNPLDLPLYDPSNIVYEGAFKVPDSWRTLPDGTQLTGSAYMIQASGGFAYNPDGDGGKGSLFSAAGIVVGNPHEPVVCEMSIPEPKKSDYNRATLLQNYEILGGTLGRFAPPENHGANGAPCTGMLYKDGYLYYTSGSLYRTIPQASTLWRRSANLSINDVVGPFSVINASYNQRAIGNGLGCVIPEIWRSTFGNATLMGGGGGGQSILANENYGPGFWVMDHTDVEGVPRGGNVPGTAILRHPHGSNQDTGYYPFMGNHPDVAWSGISWHRGSIMLPDSRTIIAYGPWAANSVYDSGGKISGFQAPIALSRIQDRFMLFDARDLKDAFDGKVTDDEGIFPYAVHDMDFCVTNGDFGPGFRGGAWDVDHRRFYIVEKNGDGSLPLVHVVKFPGTSAAAANLGQDRSVGATIAVSPNPFNSSTTIRVESSRFKVQSLKIYNLAGKLVQELKQSGTYTWHAYNQTSGMYIIKATVGGKTVTKRIVLAK